ncbi:MAG: hypothetical protein JSV88_08585 [Candidatus Aminicenantes bacterium]|nr:MAG: hypothetical protein JSV88_08585 [Candidatus Aminicenantes bacterium]
MMKIRYNIANNKKIKYLRFILFSGILLVLSLGFLILGVTNLSTTSKRFRDKKEELRTYEEKLKETTQKNKEYKEQISAIKRKWGKQRKFANSLIDGKLFSYLEKLDKLEELLPAGVFISRLTLNAESGDRVQFTIAAISSAKLMEAYRAFLEYNLSIQKESLVEGLYRANLQIKLD